MSDQDWADKVAIETYYRVKGAVFMGGLPTYDKLPPYVRVEVDAIATLIRSATPSSALVGEPDAWLIEHSFTDRNGDRCDAQTFCMKQEAEDKREELIVLWLDEQPENITEAPDDLYPIVPLYRAALASNGTGEIKEGDNGKE